MRKAIKFTPRAREDIRKIWRYTLDQWNEEQADSYIRALNDKIQQLSTHPKLGKVRRDIAKGYYCSPSQSHLIFYRITDTAISSDGLTTPTLDRARGFRWVGCRDMRGFGIQRRDHRLS